MSSSPTKWDWDHSDERVLHMNRFPFYRSSIDSSLAMLKLEDFPEIDADSEDGRDEMNHYATMVFWHCPDIRHVQIKRGGETIGEMIIPPTKDDH